MDKHRKKRFLGNTSRKGKIRTLTTISSSYASGHSLSVTRPQPIDHNEYAPEDTRSHQGTLKKKGQIYVFVRMCYSKFISHALREEVELSSLDRGMIVVLY